MYIGITKQNTQRRWRDGFGYQKQSGNISSCCHDRVKSAGGYKWKLKNR